MPSASPDLAARDVYERDIDKSGTRGTPRSTTVVFPVPEGADTTNSSPRRVRESPADAAGACVLEPGSLNVLHLLSHLLELRLERNHDSRYRRPFSFRTERVHFPVHLLDEEVELAP